MWSSGQAAGSRFSSTCFTGRPVGLHPWLIHVWRKACREKGKCLTSGHGEKGTEKETSVGILVAGEKKEEIREKGKKEGWKKTEKRDGRKKRREKKEGKKENHI